ncbi:MAG: phosphopantetheine-binding protein [Mycoplasma sp.]
MSKKDILDIIQKELEKKNVKIKVNENTVIKDLNIDSLDILEFSINVENECDVAIPEDKLLKIKTIGEFLSLIEENK